MSSFQGFTTSINTNVLTLYHWVGGSGGQKELEKERTAP